MTLFWRLKNDLYGLVSTMASRNMCRVLLFDRSQMDLMSFLFFSVCTYVEQKRKDWVLGIGLKIKNIGDLFGIMGFCRITHCPKGIKVLLLNWSDVRDLEFFLCLDFNSFQHLILVLFCSWTLLETGQMKWQCLLLYLSVHFIVWSLFLCCLVCFYFKCPFRLFFRVIFFPHPDWGGHGFM